MSFSKAKIQRFNELPNEAPPPGAYDPKFDGKGKGFAIEKTGRFNDNRSVASSGPECSKSVSSRGKAPLISPKFRTPQLLKKRLAKVLPTSCPKAKTKLNLNPKESKYDARDELADLKVECVNKDRTIQDLEKCNEEMRNEVEKLGKLLTNEEQKTRVVEEQHKKDLESMANLQQEILNSHDQKHQTELTFLRTQLLEALESKENEYSIREKVEKELKSRITELSMRCELLETELSNEKKKTKEYDELLDKFQRLEREMESREREFIEQLNEMEINKEIIVSELTDNIMDNEKKLIESREEMKQLKSTINGLTEDLQSSQSNNEFLQTECERLHEDLESRQQIILSLQSQLSSLQCEIDEIKSDNDRITSDFDSKISELISSHASEITELTTDFITEKHKFEEEKTRYSSMDRKNEDLLTKNNALINELRELKKKYNDLKLSYREVENELDNEREFSDILEDNHREEMRKLLDQIPSKTSEKSGKTPERKPLDSELSERDDRIQELTTELEELKITSATQESISQSLQEELDRAEAELVNKKKELKDLKEQIREETAEMVTRRRRFDVVMAENQATVAALAERLAESNEEVERLQHELKLSEELILEQRELLSSMTTNSKFVNEQMLNLVEQIDTKQLLDNLERANLSEIENIKVLFEEKIDDLKNLSQKEIEYLRQQVEEKENEKIELQKEIEGMSSKLSEIQGILLGLEEQNDAACIEVSELQLSKGKLEQKLKEHVEEAEEVKNSLETEIEKTKMELETLKKNQESEKKEFEEQKALLNEQMEFRRNAEKETQRLVESCERLRKNHEEITEKYNEIIGSQNHKQRLKHLNQLNEKILGLEKSLEEKCSFIEQQGKTIERLQADERRRTFTKGKENFGSIKSPFNTPVSSPHKPLTPLRERNE